MPMERSAREREGRREGWDGMARARREVGTGGLQQTHLDDGLVDLDALLGLDRHG